MHVYGATQVGSVAELAQAEQPAASARVQLAVVGLAPVAAPAADTGLAAPTGGVNAARPAVIRVAADKQDAALLEEARAQFVRDRPEVVATLRRVHPDLATAVIDEVADEWVARSLRRYRGFLEGRNDGIQELTPSGLLVTIAYEGSRAAEDPVRVLADAHQAKLIELFSRSGSATADATFQVHTVGARLSRSTAGWEADLPRKAVP